MKRSDRVQALERGLDILEYVARAEAGAGVREAAGALQLKAPTVHNLMRTLTARGYLQRGGRPVRYRLGAAAGCFGAHTPERSALEAAEDELRRLHARHPRVVLTLAQAADQSIRVVRRMGPESPGVVQRPAAHTLSPYGSSSALLFQAFWSEDQRGAFALQHPFWEEAVRLWADPAALARFLATVRRAGVAVTCFPGEELVKLAVPWFGGDGGMVGALGCAARSAELAATAQTALIAELKAAAARLARNGQAKERGG